MPKFLKGENFVSIHNTLVTLSCYRSKNHYIVRFESESGSGPTELRFPTPDKAREYWKDVKKTLAALGFTPI